ncbi:predicted protein [Naegleria gruberi]|uniref:Predicted protein n=1 Tax=Naegleria gruberi TaxID=5762 RepID=D2W277_NAEGR|nr:uncharacterized protein NAEGRDRAFT_75488 [Naegleria gruberi]EFC36774.1 predicted protein [Naegleria gruberi]|eukprot:XP_002669518.1 predicted protein [Naegleria gruberi strain NEG-M]
MTEPTVSNTPLDSNRFGMSSTTTSQPPPLALQSNNSNIMNNSNSNNNNNYSQHVSNNFIQLSEQQQTNSGNQNIGILDILSGGGGNQQLKGSSIPFSSSNNNNQTVPISSSNSIRNLNPSARKSLPSTSTLSPYHIQSSNLNDSSFSPRFARQFSQPPLSFVNEQDASNMMMGNNEELSGGEEELEMTPQQAKTNDQQNGQPTSSNGSGNSRRMNYACTECRKAHKACTGERPCDRCKKLGMEDKCKSTIRKKRILTKRYWVHFMSNDGSNNTNSMMDDSSAGDQSPASIHQQAFFPNVGAGGPQMGNARNASMNFKRHSSANLPSFSSIKRLNQGLSGGSSNSMSSFQGSEIMSTSDASMLNPNEYNNMYSGDRSPRQVPHSYNYHPYKSPRGQHPEQVMDQSSPNQTLQNNNGMNPNSGFSPRNSFNRAASSSQIPTPLQQQQQNGSYGFSGNVASLDAYRLDGKIPTGNSNTNSVESSPRESGVLNHLNMSTFNNSIGSQLDPQTVNRHYNRGSMRIQPLFNQHTKSLSDTNLLPSPSMLLDHQRQQSMFNFPSHQQTNNTNGNINNNSMAMDEFSNGNNQNSHQHHNLHIPPIMLEKNPNIPQFTIQPSPNHSNNSNSNTPRSGIFFENSPRSGNNMGSGEYYYSPRSEVDYSSDMSSLTNSPRFGTGGGADSNSSTPRSLIGSMNTMSINDSSPLAQQLSAQQQYPPGYRGSLHYDSPSLMVPGNRKSVAGYLNQAGNRFSLGSAYHGSAYVQQQQQQQSNGLSLPNSTSPSTSTTTYTNHPGNRYSLGPNQDLYQYSTRSNNFRK